MSNLVKARATLQFAWYIHRTSDGADGMPDKFVKEDLP
jgi:hypothetical protein